VTLPQLIIESNSIGLGYYADNTGPTLYNAVGSPPFPDGFVALMLTALGGSGAYALTNNSINGGKTTDLAAADPTVGYPLLSNGAPAYVVFFFEITNDYASNGVAATCLANYQAWYAGWKAAAITAGVWGTTYIVFGTPLPRGLLPGSGGWEIARASITRSVQALGLADAIVPFGQDPVMGNVATLTNTSYYRPDYTHPLLAGHAILGPLAATGVQAAFRTTRGTPQWPIVGA
jgi:hypothetical protein